MPVRKGQKLAHPERDEQEKGTALMRAIGFSCLRFSQPVRTLQTPGIPDCFYFGKDLEHLDDGDTRDRSWGIWWEWKKPGANRTPVQERVGLALSAGGQDYGWGCFDELVDYLAQHGFVQLTTGGAVQIIRRVR